jgi:hypothetical protein
MVIDVQLEGYPTSPVVRKVGNDYVRIPCAKFSDAAARLTERQAVFYRNLIRIAEAMGKGILLVDFHLPSGEHMYLDRGCIRIAELAGFVAQLKDDDAGAVSSIELVWSV